MGIKSTLRKWRDEAYHLCYGRDLVQSWSLKPFKYNSSPLHVLDIGSGDGDDIHSITQECKVPIKAWGLESHSECIAQSTSKGIQTLNIDIERSVYPFEDQFFDVIIANQILEHTKEVFWILSEVSRSLKPGGRFIVGVPNLASLHGRLQLLIGKQPSCMYLYGPHVRGFTPQDAIQLIEKGSFFKLKEYRGANFYPFPEKWAIRFARLFPNFAVCSFFLFERTEQQGTYIENLKDHDFETDFFQGPKTNKNLS